VIRNHRRAAYAAPDAEYEELTIKPMTLNHALCPGNISAMARECWDRALALGELHGYRNAQTTVLAPTGTIGLVMDCDTTGIEPDFAIVKFKKLAGGGYFKIVNQSVPKALRALGYTETEILEIERYIKGHGTLAGCPVINRATLKGKGFTDEKVDAIEKQLDGVFDIKFAFNKWTLGEEFLGSLGFGSDQIDDPSFDLLMALGFNAEEIEEANKYVCGTMTIEGAPGLKVDHLPVFDCANKCGKYGKRYIDYMGHVKMMAAAQPFITGAISKTINMPNHATVDEVARVYNESWKLMLKAIALYRDGSKLSQPLNSTSEGDLVEEVTLRDVDVNAAEMAGDENTWNENIGAVQVHERIVEKVYHRAERRRLPKRRHGFVREATVGGHKVFLRTGEYEDGTLGEIFIDMYKEGASFKGLMNCFAVLASKALQYGMPLEKMVDTFTFTRFEPSGPVFGHEAIKNATSIIDYVFRAIGYEYLGREDFVHVKAVDEGNGGEGRRNGGESNGNVNGIANGTSNGNGRAKLSPGQSLYTKPAADRAIDTTMAPPVKPIGENQKKVMTAKAQGYTGEQCGNCGSMRVKQNGACHVCEDCGTTSGCS
jgi:ribonucleoside-diphosphate reductase alpha chain